MSSEGVWENLRILLANQLQSSGSTFSCVSFPSFFAFQEGMWDTQISALPSSPTVSGRFADGQRKDGAALAFGYLPHCTCMEIGDGALTGSSSRNTGAKQSKQILWLICPRAAPSARCQHTVCWHQAHTIWS